jgi:hypothetical protein
MSVPGLMYCYGGALVGAGLLGLDKGVPVAGPAPLVPLSVGLGASMLLFGYLSTPNGQHPPKKGEAGFGLCVALCTADVALASAAEGDARTRRYMAAVHLGLLMPLAFTGAAQAAAEQHTRAAHACLMLCASWACSEARSRPQACSHTAHTPLAPSRTTQGRSRGWRCAHATLRQPVRLS